MSSFLDSVKGALSRKGSNRSMKSDKSDKSTQSTSSRIRTSRNPFLQAGGDSTVPASADAYAPPPDSYTAAAGPNAPPPSYTEATTTTTGSSSNNNPAIQINPPGSSHALRDSSPTPSRLSAASLSTTDDPYAFLASFDTVFLIDDSGSMAGQSWRETAAALRAITPICTSHDADGVDVYFLNSRAGPGPEGGWPNIRTPAEVDAIFRRVEPRGGTPTGTRIDRIMRPYLQAYERGLARSGDPDATGVKPVNMIVITDGAAGDDPETVIVRIAKKLDALDAPGHQVGIQFFQVGKERGAAQALQELDDCLGEMAGAEGLRDIVDTVTWSGRDGKVQQLSANGILKVVLGAVVRRLDRRRTSGESGRSAVRNGRLAV